MFGPARLCPTAVPDRFRVALLMQYFDLGGLERMVYNLALGIQKRGVEVIVLAYLGDGVVRQQLEEKGIRTFLVPHHSTSGWHLGLSVHLAQILREQRINILHTHHLGPFMYGAVASKLAGIPMIQTEHSHEFYDNSRRWWVGRSMDYFSVVVGVTQEIARFRKQEFGREVGIILNGVEIPSLDNSKRPHARRRLGLPDSCFVIGCVARLAQEKDHQTMLQAFWKFTQSTSTDVRLVLVGHGPEYGQIQQWICNKGLQEKVQLLGHRQDVESLLPGFDVVSLSSTREGLPLSLLEAMAHRVPVVATQVGGVGDLLRAGGGVLVLPKNPDQMHQAWHRLSQDASLREQMGCQARMIVEQTYSVSQMVDSYLRLYQEVIEVGR